MSSFFVMVWKGTPNPEIYYFSELNEMFEFIGKTGTKKISIYEANCILEWS